MTTSFYELLEVSANASKAQIDASYALRQQKYLKTYGDDPVKLALVLSLLKDAYETLIDPMRRLAHDKALDAHMAEIVEKQSHAKDTNSKVTSCYYLLGVDRGKATRDQIENSYRVSEEKLRRAFGGEPLKLERALKVIAYAYETLTDPVRKQDHDRILDAQVAEILNEHKEKSESNAALQAAQAAAQAATQAANQAAKVAANAAEQIVAAQKKAAHDAVESYKHETAKKQRRNFGIAILILIAGVGTYTYLQPNSKSSSSSEKKSFVAKESSQKKQVAEKPRVTPVESAKPVAQKSVAIKAPPPDLAAQQAAENARLQEAKRVCDNAYGQDAMLEEQIKQINDTYGTLLDRLSSQRLTASLAGAGGRSWSWAQGMQQAAAPYDNKINEVILERDNKLNKVRYEQKKLRFEYKQCYP